MTPASGSPVMRTEVWRESSNSNPSEKGKDVIQENAIASEPTENNTWLMFFEGANAQSLTIPYSGHLPLLLTPVLAAPISRHRRFCFDNMWLREETCTEIVLQSWNRIVDLDVLARIEACSHDIWSWGRKYNKDFLRKIGACKSKLEHLRLRRDTEGCREYKLTKKELLTLLE
nr:uncharacterized protein LOC109150438 [Ipomoea trifida]